jgi:hypothetical protein
MEAGKHWSRYCSGAQCQIWRAIVIAGSSYKTHVVLASSPSDLLDDILLHM